jgi:TonB family protein
MTTVSIANGVIQTSLVLGSALLLAWLLRRRSAALRHAIVATGVVCACATPFIRHFIPEWDIKPVSGVIVLEAGRLDVAAVPDAPNLVPPAPRMWGIRVLGIEDVMLAVWASGAALSLLVLAAGLFRLRQLRVAGTPLSRSKWRRQVHAETAAIGLRNHVTIVEAPHPTFAATWGVFRPTVVVPSSARDWSPERFGLVLAHEFAHVRRRDWLVHMTAAVLQSVSWFNPLAWLASRELRRLSEQACDDVVLGLGVDEAVYAGHLIDLARVKSTRGQWMFAPAEAMARQSSLEERVRAMLDTKLNRKPLSIAAWIVVAVALVALAAPAAAVGVFGQGGPGSLAGTLRDPDGRPIANQDVTLSQGGKATAHKARTDAAGAFVLTDVPAGTYDFVPGVRGFAVAYPVTVRAGQRTSSDVTLRIGQLTEAITVASAKGLPPPPPTRRVPPPPPPAYDAAADPCRQPGVSACIKPPTKLLDVRPIVPAGREGETATVIIEAEIGIGGSVEGARLFKPVDAAFGQSGLDAVRQWKFTPTRLNGNPVKVTMTVTINFTTAR